MSSDKKMLTDIIEWDVENWSQALEFWQANSSFKKKSIKALELGSRGGGISLWLSQQGMQVTCSDLSNPKATAKKLHDKHSAQNIDYAALDAVKFNGMKSKKFDLIVSKSVLGVFSDQQQTQVFDNVYDHLASGGEYWFVENLSASAMHQFARKKFVNWGQDWNYLNLQDVDIKLQKFKHVEYKTFGFLGTFGRTEAQRCALGKLDQMVFDHVVPQRWNYIIAGVAEK